MTSLLVRPRIGLSLLAFLLAFAAIAVYSAVAHADGDAERVYKVTIKNLTSGQPFTPSVLATHQRSTGLFEVGAAASLEIQQVAENGNSGPLAAALAGDGKVFDVVVDGLPPIVPVADPGGTGFPSSKSFLIKSAGRARFLSMASMLICTNDGFTGLDSLRLPKNVGDSVTVMAGSYDAGTEINTEDFVDMVPPCQGLIGVSSADPGTGMTDPALAEGGVIVSPHPGIAGGVDLVDIHKWTEPVAEIVVERLALEFGAKLDGGQETTPVVTDTSGKIEVEFDANLTEADFRLKVFDGVAITQAHFHCGPAGANGPVVAFLFGRVPGGFDVDGLLADFTLTDANIAAVGADCVPSIGMAIENIADLAKAMQDGNIYANVHSEANPSGEVRGQLAAMARDGGDDDDDDDDERRRGGDKDKDD